MIALVLFLTLILFQPDPYNRMGHITCTRTGDVSVSNIMFNFQDKLRILCVPPDNDHD